MWYWQRWPYPSPGISESCADIVLVQQVRGISTIVANSIATPGRQSRTTSHIGSLTALRQGNPCDQAQINHANFILLGKWMPAKPFSSVSSSSRPYVSMGGGNSGNGTWSIRTFNNGFRGGLDQSLEEGPLSMLRYSVEVWWLALGKSSPRRHEPGPTAD